MELREQLLRLARQAIETLFTKKRIDPSLTTGLEERRGVFVTIMKGGELRGCIGYPLPELPLAGGIVKAARAAALHDPRFPALQPEELGEIRLEVTLLTPPERIIVDSPEEYVRKVKVGRDGLIIKRGFHHGLLLPQVPAEYGWNAETFLEHLCLKAGLPTNAWKEEGTIIERFQGEVYREEEGKEEKD